MRRLTLLCFVVLAAGACQQPPADYIEAIVDNYLVEWAGFYPSRALSAGQAEAATRLEDFNQPTVEAWMAVNQQTLDRIRALPEASTLDERIDRQLLEGQIQRELFAWGEAEIHRTDPQTYSNLINHALTAVLVRSNLTDEMKFDAAIERLRGLERICETAKIQLGDGRPSATEASIRDIRSTAEFIEGNLVSALGVADDNPRTRSALGDRPFRPRLALNELADWLESDLELGLGDAYGEELYARKLALAYGAHLTPEILEQIAMTEIETVRALMEELAQERIGPLIRRPTSMPSSSRSWRRWRATAPPIKPSSCRSFSISSIDRGCSS